MDYGIEMNRRLSAQHELLQALGAFAHNGYDRHAIVDLHRRPLDWGRRSKFDSLQIVVRGGRTVSAVLKDYGARAPCDDARTRFARERTVYCDLLAPARIDTARYFGSFSDPGRSRYWLALEHVSGSPLHLREPAHFQLAAVWLGRLSAHFRLHPESLEIGGSLLRHDADFFRSLAGRGREKAAALAPALGRRTDFVLETYEGLIDELAGEPASLVHGAFRRHHVLVATGSDPLRIRPVDWEYAALGSPLFDLARLMEGCTPETRERMLESFRDELLRHGVPRPDGWRMRRLLCCFRLHHALAALAELEPGRGVEPAAARIEEAAWKLARQVRDEAFDE